MIGALASAVLAVSLLPSAQLKRAAGVQYEQRIRDGVVADDGAEWNSDTAALIEVGGAIEWDLGKAEPVAGALLQGDNNDDYIVWGSLDGENYAVLWRAPPAPDPGLRTRTVVIDPPVNARFIRLTAEGGDNFYSVSELQLYSTVDEARAHAQQIVKQVQRTSNPEGFNPMWIVLAAFAAGIVYFWVLRRKPAEEPEPPKAEEKKE